MVSLPKTAYTMYDAYGNINKTKEKIKPYADIYNQAKNQGLSDQQISQYLGMDTKELDQIKTFANNSTLDIFGKMLTDDNFS